MKTKTKNDGITVWDIFNMIAARELEAAKVEKALCNARMIHDDDPCVYHALTVQVVEARLSELKSEISNLKEWRDVLQDCTNWIAE